MATVTLTSAVAGQVCTAVFYNNNQNAIINQVNGNLDSTNLANLAVTNAKIASGAVSGTKIAMGSDAQGDLLYYNGSQYTRLGAGSAGQVLITNGAGANPSWDYAAAVQVKNTQTGAVATGSTAIPNDDTIPQNNEGDEYMTLAITPKSATNKLKIDVVLQGEVAGGNAAGVCLFQDSTADALAAMYFDTTNGIAFNIMFTHYMTAGTTSATTFKVRAGAEGASFTFNGNSGARKYGGVIPSSITITEVKP